MGGDNSNDPVLDLEGTLTRLGGDKELFAELIGYLWEDAPRLFQELSAAVQAGDAEAVRSRAHALKGLIAGCGGVRATKVAQQLEDAGSSADLSNASDLLQQLDSELNEFYKALAPKPR
jgi:two-component system, sensor histidine kinase and response regulator